MNAPSVAAEVALDPSREHAELVNRALLRISRNLLRYQQIEHGLKAVLPGSTRAEPQDSLANSEAEDRSGLLVSETLGSLHRRWTELVHRLCDGASDITGHGDVVASEERIERERRVIDDRNRLVHHLDRLRLAEADGCRVLIAELDGAFARAEEWHRCVHWLSIGARLARGDAFSDRPRADALRVVRVDTGPTPVRAVVDSSVQMQQDAIAALRRICAADWKPLSIVGQLLYVQVPDIQAQIKKAGGLERWIGAVAVLEMRAHSLGNERTRAEVRLRAGTSKVR